MQGLISGDVFIRYLIKALFYIMYSWLALLLLSCSECSRFNPLALELDIYSLANHLCAM